MGSFEEWISWCVRVNEPSPQQMWSDNPTFLLVSILFIILGSVTALSCFKCGFKTRFPYLWIAAYLYGIFMETVSYNVPGINNFWHSQTFLMLCGQRLPFHITLYYPAIIVNACIAVNHMNLRRWAKPFAVGLLCFLLDAPFDIIAVKFVFWTWHDTDPNIYDRTYGVPWTALLFQLTFNSSFVILLEGSRFVMSECKNTDRSVGCFKEMVCVVVAATGTMPLAVLTQFLPLYHGPKDGYGIHSEVIVCSFLALYSAIVWSASIPPCSPAEENSLSTRRPRGDEAWISVVGYFTTLMAAIAVGTPENVVSHSLRQPIGPKSETVQLYSAYGSVYSKQRFFDPSSYDNTNIDFHCVPDSTLAFEGNSLIKGKEWYTVCGTPFVNRYEHIAVVWCYCIIGILAFYTAFNTPRNKASYSDPKLGAAKNANSETIFYLGKQKAA